MIANISQSICDEQIKTALMNKSKLLGAARRITGCASLAEDIVQEVLLQLVAKPLPPDIAVPASYMMRMVRNLATDHMRRLRYERGLFAVEEEGDSTSDYGSPEEHLREVEAYQAFCCTMEAMPPRTRKFYEDHFFEGCRKILSPGRQVSPAPWSAGCCVMPMRNAWLPSARMG